MDLHESTTHPHPLMTALAGGLPITLLIDLIDPNGPRSFEMFERETTKADGGRLAADSVVIRIA